MAQIFNRSSDNYIFTGSRLRAGTSNTSLRLSTALNEAIIDLCNNSNVDISASAVFINGLKVVTTSSGDATALTALQLAQNLDVSGMIYSEGGIQIGSGHYGGTITKSSNVHEIVIDPFGIDGSNSSTHDASGCVIIMGDLIVRGNTTTIHSTDINISDVKLTLASGSISTSKANEAGIEIGDDGYAKLLYDSAINVWKTNIGVDISGDLSLNGSINYRGNVVPLNNSSQLPVTWNTFALKTTSLLANIGDSSNTWIDASAFGYVLSKVVLSKNSYIKIEFKVNYVSSPEADQTLSFRTLKSINGIDGSYNNTVFSDLSLGSNMGVTLNNVYYGTFIDNLANADLSNSTVSYKLEFMRNCPNGDSISTPFGIVESSGNYISLQELYKP